MSRSGAGTYSLPAGQPVVTGTVISATTFNTLMSDVATELTDSLSRSAKGAMLGILQLANGASVLAPDLTWTGDTNTGFYHSAADTIDVATAGVKVLEFKPAGSVLFVGIAAPGAPASGDFWYDTGTTLPRFTGKLNGIVSGTLVGPSYAANWSDSVTVKYWLGLDGMVHIKGVAASAGGATSTIFTLPAGYRPSATRWFSCPDASLATAVQITVTVAGVVAVNNGFSAGEAYALDGVSFLAEA